MIGAGLGACGGGGPNFGPETAPSASQQTAITSTETSLTELATVDTDGSAAAAAAFELVGSSALLVANPSARLLPEISAVPALDLRSLAAHRQAPPDPCEVVTSTSVKWTHCVEDEFTIDGSISWTTDHVDMSVTMTGAAEGFSFNYKLQGSMSASATAIQGNMSVAVSVTSGAMSASEKVDWDIDVQIAQGCITSGTLTVEASGSGAGSTSGAVQVIWTGCHMSRVRNG
jgi:hypothetical protein